MWQVVALAAGNHRLAGTDGGNAGGIFVNIVGGQAGEWRKASEIVLRWIAVRSDALLTGRLSAAVSLPLREYIAVALHGGRTNVAACWT